MLFDYTTNKLKGMEKGKALTPCIRMNQGYSLNWSVNYV